MEELETIVEFSGRDQHRVDEISRRTFLSGITSTAIAAVVPAIIILPSETEARRGTNQNSVDYSKIPVPKVGYTPIVKEPNLSNIVLVDRDTDIGKIQRALRWSNITEAVENRYGIPKNVLLGMICAESEGDPSQPNAKGDGGAGSIHMQPKSATKYGLRLISPSTKLVDYEQGRLLKKAIQETGGDLKKLIKYDDRFHPIINIDAAARMLCDLYQKQNSGTRSWTRALERYAGRRAYDSRVIDFANKINNPRFMKVVKFNFDYKNPDVRVGGRSINFDRWIGFFHQLNRNYGLDDYRRLPRHRVL